ncbi:hypothetical protein LSTR_LSTR016296 [Laodelphax striatellus]|uniref:Sushi domain-containing protein n=1 Tax=Laodelphax striatellus TaxID=195883 RepID=A0A482XAS2_LAOST|nr:hypothetical protein LSTR_LSTR016296 [Laodelphax striatellus]
MVCYDGKWYPPNNVCIKLCPALNPQNSDLKCFLRNEPVSCKENIRPRTIAYRTCKSGHIDQSNTCPENICKDNGEWDHKYPDCFLGHGVLSNITGAIASLASLIPRGGGIKPKPSCKPNPSCFPRNPDFPNSSFNEGM